MRALLPVALCAWLAGCAVSETPDFSGLTPKKGDASKDGVATDGDDDEDAPGDKDSSASDSSGDDSTALDSSAPDTASGDSGEPDSGAPDTEPPDTTPPDTGVLDTAPIDTGPVDTGPPPGGATVTFPATGDTKSIKYDPYMWNSGDAVEGTRSTTVAAATSLTGTWEIGNTLATKCGPFSVYNGVLTVDVSLNGKKVGTLNVTKASGASVPVNLTFAAVAGPTYKIRYAATNTVIAGCGSVEVKLDVSKLTLK